MRISPEPHPTLFAEAVTSWELFSLRSWFDGVAEVRTFKLWAGGDAHVGTDPAHAQSP